MGTITGLTLGLVISSFLFLLKLQGAVDSCNARLRMLLKHHGIDMEQAAVNDARPLLEAGKKIEAIKRYRELTGASLAEAKTAVERLQ
jgi:hypothetical protein